MKHLDTFNTGNSTCIARSQFKSVNGNHTKDHKKKRLAPFSLRLNADERARLEDMAGRESLSGFIKGRLFDPNKPIVKRRNLNPVQNKKLLGQVLGALGRSRLSQNMNQLAKAAHVGNLPLPEDVERLLVAACADIADMRQMLMQALGVKS